MWSSNYSTRNPRVPNCVIRWPKHQNAWVRIQIFFPFVISIKCPGKWNFCSWFLLAVFSFQFYGRWNICSRFLLAIFSYQLYTEIFCTIPSLVVLYSLWKTSVHSSAPLQFTTIPCDLFILSPSFGIIYGNTQFCITCIIRPFFLVNYTSKCLCIFEVFMEKLLHLLWEWDI